MIKNKQSEQQAAETEAALRRVDRLLLECDRRHISPVQALEDTIREYDLTVGPGGQFQQRRDR